MELKWRNWCVVSNKIAKKHHNRYTNTTQIHDSSRSWFDTGTSIKRGCVKLVTYAQTSPLTEIRGVMQVSNVHMSTHSTTKELKVIYGNRSSVIFKKGMHIVDIFRIKSYAPIYAFSSTYIACNMMSMYIKWKVKMSHMYHKEQRIIKLVI